MGATTRTAISTVTWTLHRAILLLPPGRRSWGEAVRAEAEEFPSGRERLQWLLGGLWTVARMAGLLRGVGFTVVAGAAGAGLVWLDRHPGSANPATPTNRLALIITVGLLALLPWVVRVVLGPVADSRTARTVRVAGYVAVYVLLLVMVGLSRFASSRFDHFQAFDQANWEADMRSGAIVGAVLLIALIGAYAVAVLAVTARRPAVPPGVLAAATVIGSLAAVIGYALMPLGNPLRPGNGLLSMVYAIVLLAFWVAVVWVAIRLRLGAVGGLCAGGAAAILLAIFTISTMLLLPTHVDRKWANPDPAVAHGTPYEIQMSVGDAAIKYEFGLLLGPLVGLIIGGIAGRDFSRADVENPRSVPSRV